MIPAGPPQQDVRMRSPASQTHEGAKKRKLRPVYSCTECRRLKMKCDRQVPCKNCVRRKCALKCQFDEDRTPSQRTTGQESMAKSSEDASRERLAELERILQSNDIAIPSPSPLPRPPDAIHSTTREAPLRQEVIDLPHVSFSLPLEPSLQPLPTSSTDALALASSSRPPLSLDPQSTETINTTPSGGMYVGDAGDGGESHGTLVIGRAGQSRYLGRTAASEWLKNQELGPESPPPQPSHMPSPSMRQIPLHGGEGSFPFHTAAVRSTSTRSLIRSLPEKSEAETLVDVYYRHFAWHFNVISRPKLVEILDNIYAFVQAADMLPDALITSRDIPPDRLALLFIVFAMGSYYNLELPPDDPVAEEYLEKANICLTKFDFMAHHSMPVVQTLHIMAHLLLSLESGKDGDRTWTLWGLTSRIVQAMGLHRDGERWGLPVDAVEERRRVFWEVQSTDCLTSNSFSRNGPISLAYVDTKFPSNQPDITPFFIARYNMAGPVSRILDHAMRVKIPPLSEVQSIHAELGEFERSIPYDMRCRPVLTVLSSIYPDPKMADAEAPPTDKRNFHKTFQQFTLAMNVCESFVLLHRPYFARALHESPKDPTKSIYAQSYLCVIERCNAIVVVASSLQAMYPQIAARHWWIWYHTFNSAVCMATLIVRNPLNPLGPYALALVDTALSTYRKVIRSRNSPRMNRNLAWLERLLLRITAKLAKAPLPDGAVEESDSEDDAELLGWKTRLIERAGQGLRSARTIQSRQQVTPDTVSTADVPLRPSSQPAIDSSQAVSAAVSGDGSAFTDDDWLNSWWNATPTGAAQAGDLESVFGRPYSLDWWRSE